MSTTTTATAANTTTTDCFVISSISSALKHIEARYEVSEVLKELVTDVDVWHRENLYVDTFNELSEERAVSRKQNKELLMLDSENKHLKEQIELVKKKSNALKDRFMIDIGYVLRESKKVNDYKKTIAAQERVIQENNEQNFQLQEQIKRLEDDLAEIQMTKMQTSNESGMDDSIDDQEGNVLTLTAPSSSSHATKKSKIVRLIDLDDMVLLTVFSFLDTYDVISAAQICKSLYARVDTLFGMEGGATFTSGEYGEVDGEEGRHSVEGSEKLKEESSDTPTARMMHEIDALSKKLSGNELQLILSMTERMKALSIDVENITAEKEDTAANLQSAETVRDFLVEKLKSAEVALKSAINEIGLLKKQNESDQEVIAYLDLRTNDLEIENAEYLNKCKSVQSSMEVQNGAHTYMERLLTNEVADYKLRLESAESTFKLQKKVLVKEVKSLRGQLATSQKERDLFKVKLGKFKDAINSI